MTRIQRRIEHWRQESYLRMEQKRKRELFLAERRSKLQAMLNAMTPQQRDAYWRDRKAKLEDRFAKETPEQKEARRAKDSEDVRERYANMTLEQREVRRAKNNSYNYRKKLSTLALLYAFEMMKKEA